MVERIIGISLMETICVRAYDLTFTPERCLLKIPKKKKNRTMVDHIPKHVQGPG